MAPTKTTESERSPDRDATERALQDAALRLMERNGVLAGLNLKEVAAEAGVNRGLVYHYFGSRRELLRASLSRSARTRFTDVTEAGDLPFRERMLAFIHTMVRHRQAVRLATLLISDGDESLRTMPLRDLTRQRLAQDVDAGNLDDVDLEAVHVATVSLTYGYVLYRERFAHELGISVTELDDRFGAVADRMYRGLEPG